MLIACALRRYSSASAAALLGLTLVCPLALAATTTGSMSISTTVMGVCVIGQPTLMALAAQNTEYRKSVTRTTVTLTCSQGLAYRIGMSSRTAAGGAARTRRSTVSLGPVGETQDRGAGEMLARDAVMATDISSAMAFSGSSSSTREFHGQIPSVEPMTGHDQDSVFITVAY